MLEYKRREKTIIYIYIYILLSGRSYAVYTQKMLHASLESLVQKVQTGVVINFEKIGPDPPPLAEGKQLWN